MNAIRLRATVDENHRLTAQAPPSVSPGTVEIALLMEAAPAGEDDAGAVWAEGVAREWADDLADPRQDLYTESDGEPADAAR
jgi:hypothetical protein